MLGLQGFRVYAFRNLNKGLGFRGLNCYRTPRLRQQCLRATQLCCKELNLSADFELGMVHLLIYSSFCKVGKSAVECTEGLD